MDSQDVTQTAGIDGAATGNGPVTETTAAEATTDSSEGTDGFTEPEYDFEAFGKTLKDAQERAVTRAELDTVKRQAGHVKTLQKELAGLRKQVADGSSDPRIDAIIDTLTASLDGIITTDAAAALRGLRKTEKDAAIAEMQEQIAALKGEKADAAEEPDVTPEQAALAAAWDAASSAVYTYAKQRGYDADSFTPTDWATAQRIGNGDPTLATKALLAEIDRRVSSGGAAGTRRAERRDAASGGPDGVERANTGGALTRAKLLEMSVDEVMAIPRAERNAVLARG